MEELEGQKIGVAIGISNPDAVEVSTCLLMHQAVRAEFDSHLLRT